jgi:N-terminal acetyltransferase B complex non-catalytic subunit
LLTLFRLREAVLSEVEAHLKPDSGIDKSWRRNASLAKVTILSKEHSQFSLETASATDRVDIIEEYLTTYGSATTTYGDLRPFIEQLKENEKQSLLSNLLENKLFGTASSEKENVSRASSYSQNTTRPTCPYSCFAHFVRTRVCLLLL